MQGLRWKSRREDSSAHCLDSFITMRKSVGDHRHYLPVRGGSFKAPRAISNSSAAASASTGGGVGNGKLITYRHQEKMPFSTSLTWL